MHASSLTGQPCMPGLAGAAPIILFSELRAQLRSIRSSVSVARAERDLLSCPRHAAADDIRV